jgi:hypothetical protein
LSPSVSSVTRRHPARGVLDGGRKERRAGAAAAMIGVDDHVLQRGDALAERRRNGEQQAHHPDDARPVAQHEHAPDARSAMIRRSPRACAAGRA